MASEFINIEDLISNQTYYITKYQWLYGNVGFYYIITIKPSNSETTNKLLISEGNIFDYLENVRKNNISDSISIKASSNLINSTSITYVGINNLNDEKSLSVPE